ncbi:hypothetical protein [Streptomyces katrae]|uniref:hypothetical protein n=1 Tax=Streptomyces katrae TaxID=68223 RepID=UPI000AEE2F49|nr:hypothetical protein [Streptomyces katrae]
MTMSDGAGNDPAATPRRRTAVLRRTVLLGLARGASTALGSAVVAALLWRLRTR